MKDRFKYLFEWVNNFSKYALVIPIRNKQAISAKKLAQVFIN